MTQDQEHARGVVLIVDDSPVSRLALNALLRKEHEVLLASSGRECLEMVATRKPDLILLDVMMPGMDGYETCSRLKADPATRDIPVIFVSASSDEESEAWGLEIGAADFIPKPFRAPVVLVRVRNQIDLKRFRERLESSTCRDELTGIANAGKFDEYFEQEWKRAIRYGRELALILIDLDDFEEFNAIYGHLHGDTTLERVASVLARTPRRSADMVARLHGTHFAVVLPETGYSGAMSVAENLKNTVAALEIPHRASCTGPCLSVSLGVAAMIPKIGQLSQALFVQAENNLQQAKRDGRNRIVG